MRVHCICRGSLAASECHVVMLTNTILLRPSSAVSSSKALSFPHVSTICCGAQLIDCKMLWYRTGVSYMWRAGQVHWQGYWLLSSCMCHSVDLQCSSDWHAFYVYSDTSYELQHSLNCFCRQGCSTFASRQQYQSFVGGLTTMSEMATDTANNLHVKRKTFLRRKQKQAL